MDPPHAARNTKSSGALCLPARVMVVTRYSKTLKLAASLRGSLVPASAHEEQQHPHDDVRKHQGNRQPILARDAPDPLDQIFTIGNELHTLPVPAKIRGQLRHRRVKG